MYSDAGQEQAEPNFKPCPNSATMQSSLAISTMAAAYAQGRPAPVPPQEGGWGEREKKTHEYVSVSHPHPQGLRDRLNQLHHRRPGATTPRQAPPTRVGQGCQRSSRLQQLLGGCSQQGGAGRLQRGLMWRGGHQVITRV
jgi:hypothetical protein